MPWGISFFHTDKDQFERLRLLVIRYKMVVGGLVCQKSIAGAIHFTLPTGSYNEDSTASLPAHTQTHTHMHRRTHYILYWNALHLVVVSGSVSVGLCVGVFLFETFPPFYLSSTYLFPHCYSTVGGLQVHLRLGPYLSKWDWQLAFSSLRDYGQRAREAKFSLHYFFFYRTRRWPSQPGLTLLRPLKSRLIHTS